LIEAADFNQTTTVKGHTTINLKKPTIVQLIDTIYRRQY
jgi:hypothetical protein